MPAHAASRLDAYYFWGALPSPDRLRRQLTAFRDQGFSRIYIQARLSMPRAVYLSPEYLKTYAQAVEIISDLGLKAGLYDDYAWTSGQAGGRTVEGAEHLRERHVFWTRGAAPELTIRQIRATLGASLGPAVRDWTHEGGTVDCDAWQPVGAVLEHADGRTEDVSAHVTAQGDTGRFRLSRPLPEGARWTVFAAARLRNSRIINYLMPEAGARFVEIGLHPYAEALGDHLGRTVDCLFYDQPAPSLLDWQGRFGNLRNSLPWSDALAEKLSTHGPLAPQLWALLDDGAPGNGLIRARVYRTVTSMMQQAFFAPLRAFCEAHGLTLTGHEILPHVASMALNGGFSAIDPRVAMAADFFGTDLWRDQTSVDANNLGAQLAPLLGDSIARASGRRGAWTELYLTSQRSEHRAIGQWEITPQALRAQLIRLHMLGASRVILHALFAEAGDARPEPLANMRFDFAPGYNLQPWWPVMGAIGAEAARLADFIEGASPPEQVALLYPYETALRKGPRHDHARRFGSWCEWLLAQGHRPLIVDEHGLAQVQGGRLYGARLAALALPGPVTLRDPVRHGLATYTSPPAEPLLTASPIVAAQPGLRALVAGVDAAGQWRIVLFNEGAAPLTAQIAFAGAARELALEAQELRCLTLPADGGARIPAPSAASSVAQVLDDGWTLKIDGRTQPVRVTSGWQAQGHPAYSGTGHYECHFVIKAAEHLALLLPGLACAARVTLDGRDMGTCCHAPFRVSLGLLAPGPHLLRIAVFNTMANAFYADTPFAGPGWPDVSGLTQPPVLIHEGAS
ncbi:hypothetical protein Q4543_20230 [Salipiger sp. 1_MG-2023]|uniref:hypothetical protein n=1 Tax=Salipiger sp. 1_MG-2023 TaxID=3062665 RepID=UPI0026E35616|nr:hypothetical protein [Salipiger sp. 1_MG-2023]MDO6587844.1 hypothetical protein [Salipiger sp. 1_MG-2023]